MPNLEACCIFLSSIKQTLRYKISHFRKKRKIFLHNSNDSIGLTQRNAYRAVTPIKSVKFDFIGLIEKISQSKAFPHFLIMINNNSEVTSEVNLAGNEL